jgi:hypothetical protein
MSNADANFATLRQFVDSLDSDSVARVLKKLGYYDENADAFVLLTIQDATVTGEQPRLVDVQRRILSFLLTKTDPRASHTPAELADGIAERNRKVLREAGRLLIAKNVLTAVTEPCDGSEGERVVSYTPTKAIEDAFEEYQDARNGFFDDETLEDEAAAAQKQ